jgi:hypothetical protein
MSESGSRSHLDFHKVPLAEIDSQWIKEKKAQLRDIVSSGFNKLDEDSSQEAWLINNLRSFKVFREAEFNHKNFAGKGVDLLFKLGINNKKEFENFVNTVFPEQAGDIIILNQEKPSAVYQKDRRNEIIEQIIRPVSATDDAERLLAELEENSESEEIKAALKTFFGPYMEPSLAAEEVPDPMVMSAVKEAWKSLSRKAQIILTERIAKDATLEEISSMKKIGVTPERVRQLYNKAIRKLRAELSGQFLDSPHAARDIREALDKPVVTEQEKDEQRLVHFIETYFISGVNLGLTQVSKLISAKFISESKRLKADLDEMCAEKARKIVQDLFPDQRSILFKDMNKKPGAKEDVLDDITKNRLQRMYKMLDKEAEELKATSLKMLKIYS